MLSRGFTGGIRLRRQLRFGARELAFTLGWAAVFAAMRMVNVSVLLGNMATGVMR